jgi:hypothetical protein
MKLTNKTTCLTMVSFLLGNFLGFLLPHRKCNAGLFLSINTDHPKMVLNDDGIRQFILGNDERFSNTTETVEHNALNQINKHCITQRKICLLEQTPQVIAIREKWVHSILEFNDADRLMERFFETF